MKLSVSLGAERIPDDERPLTVANVRAKILGYCWPDVKHEPNYCHHLCYQYVSDLGFPENLDILMVQSSTHAGEVDHSIVVDGTNLVYDSNQRLGKLDPRQPSYPASFDGKHYFLRPNDGGRPILGKVTAQELRKEAAEANAFLAHAETATDQMRDRLLKCARGARVNTKNSLYASYLYVKEHGYDDRMRVQLMVNRENEDTHAVVTKSGSIEYDWFRHLDDYAMPGVRSMRTTLHVPSSRYTVDGALTAFKIMGYVTVAELKAVDPDYRDR